MRIRIPAACVAALLTFLPIAHSYAQQVLKLNEPMGPGSSEAIALDHFSKEVAARSKGALRIAVSFKGTLGDQHTSVENVMMGDLDLYSGGIENYVPLAIDELTAARIPFILPDIAAFARYAASPLFGRAKTKIIEDRGVRFLELSGERGPYEVLVSTKPVVRPDDLRGFKLKTSLNGYEIRAWAAFGAVPVQIPSGQIGEALRSGKIDGVLLPLNEVREAKITGIAPYITNLRIHPQIWPIAVSERSWKKLSSDQQNLLTESAEGAAKLYSATMHKRVDTDVAAMIAADNAAFIRVNPLQFRDKLKPYYQELVQEGSTHREVLDAADAAISGRK